MQLSDDNGYEDPHETTTTMTVAEPERPTAENDMNETDLIESQIQWSVSADGNAFWGSGKVQGTVPAGLYRTEHHDQIGLVLVKQIISTDALIELKESTSIQIVHDIQQFWNSKAAFNKRGLLHKRGIMLMGDPGSGKTSTIQLIIQHMIKNNGIVLYPDPHNPDVVAGCMQMIRRLEKDRPILLILEDFETIVTNPHSENIWLAILDGEQQVDNIVFLATTNYISKIDKRFIDRPSRFDLLIQIDMPSTAMRKQYISTKEPEMEKDELNLWVKQTKDLSIAHLKELIISVKCFGHTFEDTLARMRKMRDRNYTEEDFIDKPNKVGFKR